jgi:1-deoxy-D-xylulose-5-phosphate reductoisomerase
MRQRLSILGSTGSVGANTLDVVARHPERFEVFALTAATQVESMLQQCAQFRPRFAVMADAEAARRLGERVRAEGLPVEVMAGAEAIAEVAAHPDVHAVMAAIVGAAGLAPCLAAARAGKRLLLANKEALVVGGRLFMEAVHAGGATLLPIDSEHSAIFQCLPDDRSAWAERIDHIVLTASGGPFRTRERSSLADVTPEEACAHPNWVMGRKISVDSATMMNKALEVIEARWLFDLEPERIRVVLHPQSIIHSMVVCRDGSVLAQLGTPDMKVPISVGLAHPERIASGASRLDFLALQDLGFEALDDARFPGLALAYAALAGPEGSTTVLNAANEVAVAAFLDRRARFTDIHGINAGTLERVRPGNDDPQSLESLLALDARSRRAAAALVQELYR